MKTPPAYLNQVRNVFDEKVTVNSFNRTFFCFFSGIILVKKKRCQRCRTMCRTINLQNNIVIMKFQLEVFKTKINFRITQQCISSCVFSKKKKNVMTNAILFFTGKKKNHCPFKNLQVLNSDFFCQSFRNSFFLFQSWSETRSVEPCWTKSRNGKKCINYHFKHFFGEKVYDFKICFLEEKVFEKTRDLAGMMRFLKRHVYHFSISNPSFWGIIWFEFFRLFGGRWLGANGRKMKKNDTRFCTLKKCLRGRNFWPCVGGFWELSEIFYTKK